MLYLITTSMDNTPIALVSGNDKNDEHDIMMKMFKQFGFTRSSEYAYSFPGRLYIDTNIMLKAKKNNMYQLIKTMSNMWFGEWGNRFYLIYKDINPEYNIQNIERFSRDLSVFPKSRDVKRCVTFKFSNSYWKQRWLWLCSDWSDADEY